MSRLCPACSGTIPLDSQFCPKCGKALPSEEDVTISEPEAISKRHETPGAAPKASRSDVVAPIRADLSYDSDASLHGRFVPGTIIAQRYRIVALLGRGGMGEVYRADDLTLGQPVALKFLSGLGATPRQLELFHSEVRLSRQVAHPNVCRVYDIGEIDGQQFLSMEYIDGEDLKGLLQRIGRLPRDKGVQIAQQLCAGLAAAHDKAVLHRDLKPANIMLDGRGHVRITDFGLAAIADENQGSKGPVGTPAYMAPEQLAEGKTTIQSDLYSLGLILYEVFTGKRVHQGRSIPELLREHQESSVSRPSAVVDDMDPAVERVILHCLDRDAPARPASARAVAAALPGGDPLAAALAAGETPSPEMIAAAGQTGLLPMKVGVGLVAAIAVLVVALPIVSQWVGRIAWSGMQHNSPAVLERDALQWVEQLGYADLDADRVTQLKSSKRDYALEYLYRQRQSPLTIDPMIARFYSSPVWKPTLDNPSVLEPGMVSLRLDPRRAFREDGQLLEFLAVPGPASAPGDWVAESDEPWGKFFNSAGFEEVDPADKDTLLNKYGFADITSTIVDDGTSLRPPVFADQISYWAHDPGATAPDLIMAALNGRPVYFRNFGAESFDASKLGMMFRWLESTMLDLESGANSNVPLNLSKGLMARQPDFRISEAIMLILTYGAALILAAFNLKAGRADTKGGFRLAGYLFVGEIVLWTIALEHQLSNPAREFFQDANYLIFASARVFRAWIYYIALEPYVRRYWPNVLISWSRLLGGRLRDPQIGRDLMVGCLCGLPLVIALQVLSAHRLFVDLDLAADHSLLFGKAVASHLDSIRGSLYYLALLLVVRMICRNMILAGICSVPLVVLPINWMMGFDYGIGPWITATIWAVLLVVLLIRFGLLSVIAFYFTVVCLQHIPHTTDLGAWYGIGSKFALGIILLIAGYGFYTSTLRGRTSVPVGGAVES